VFTGLTPLEALKRKTIDKNSLFNEMLRAKAERMKENKKEMCCSFSF
jgi:hypothetical protein